MKTLVIFDDATTSFRCAGCLDHPYEVTRWVMRDPEKFMAAREKVEADHAECGNYTNPKMALNNRLMKRSVAREEERLIRKTLGVTMRRMPAEARI